jgi:hypothetical protein
MAAPGQICFPTKDGLYLVCNFIMRGGKKVKSPTGKWLKIPIDGKGPKKETEPLVGPVSKQ